MRIFEAYVREYPQKVWPYMAQYLHQLDPEMTMDLYIQDKRLWYEPPGTGIMNRIGKIGRDSSEILRRLPLTPISTDDYLIISYCHTQYVYIYIHTYIYNLIYNQIYTIMYSYNCAVLLLLLLLIIIIIIIKNKHLQHLEY